MPDKTVTVNVDFSSPTNPVFSFSGDVDPGDAEIVDVDGHSDEIVTWTLTATNNPDGAVTFTESDPIVFAGGTEDEWADGTAPTVTRVSDTQVTITDDNEAVHNGVLVHYYQINVVYNGVTYTKDPEVEEQGGGGI